MPRSWGEGADVGVPLVLLLVTIRERATRGRASLTAGKGHLVYQKEPQVRARQNEEERNGGFEKQESLVRVFERMVG